MELGMSLADAVSLLASAYAVFKAHDIQRKLAKSSSRRHISELLKELMRTMKGTSRRKNDEATQVSLAKIESLCEELEAGLSWFARWTEPALAAAIRKTRTTVLESRKNYTPWKVNAEVASLVQALRIEDKKREAKSNAK